MTLLHKKWDEQNLDSNHPLLTGYKRGWITGMIVMGKKRRVEKQEVEGALTV